MCGATLLICLMIILYHAHPLRCYHHLTHLIPFPPICIMSVNGAMFTVKNEIGR